MANAIKAVTRLSEAGSAPSGTYRTTGIISPVNGALYLVSVVAGDAQPPSVAITGAGMTWVAVTSDTAVSNAGLYILRSMTTASPSQDNLTIDLGGQAVNDLIVQVFEVVFVSTGGTNGSAAVVQSQADSTASAQIASPAYTYAAFADATNNLQFEVGAHKSVENTAIQSTFVPATKLADQAGKNWQAAAAYHTGRIASGAFSWATSALRMTAGLEIQIRAAASKVWLPIGPAFESDSCLSVAPIGGTPASQATEVGLALTTRGTMVQRVGEKLGLAYDVSGFEQDYLRGLFNEAIREVLLDTHVTLSIGEATLTANQSEYRLQTSILAIDDGRGSTPSGIGHYDLVSLDEMIQRQSIGIVSPTYRKAVAIEGNLLIVDPVPSTGEVLRFYYVARPTETTSDAHDFTDITYGGLPEWCSQAVEYYMLWQGAEYDQKQQTGSKDMGPTDYYMTYLDKCKLIRQRKRKMRARTMLLPRIGYPGFRAPYASRNDQYPKYGS